MREHAPNERGMPRSSAQLPLDIIWMRELHGAVERKPAVARAFAEVAMAARAKDFIMVCRRTHAAQRALATRARTQCRAQGRGEKGKHLRPPLQSTAAGEEREKFPYGSPAE